MALLKAFLAILALSGPLFSAPQIEYSGYYSDLVKLTPELDDATRIPLHFNFLLKKFKAKDLNGLSPELRRARAMNLSHLAEYRDLGVFPKNVHVPWRQPVFIDKDGTFCAVGYLVKASGHEAEARQISRQENLAYVKDIQSPELARWVAASGLSLEECAMIQPGYCWDLELPCPSNGFAPVAEATLFYLKNDPSLFQLRTYSNEPITQVAATLTYADGSSVLISEFGPTIEMVLDTPELSVMSNGKIAVSGSAYSLSFSVASALNGVGASFYESYYLDGYHYSAKIPIDQLATLPSCLRENLYDSYFMGGCGNDVYPGCMTEVGYMACGRLPRRADQVVSIHVTFMDGDGMHGSISALKLMPLNDDLSLAVAGASPSHLGSFSKYFEPHLGTGPSLCIGGASYALKAPASPTPQPELCGPRIEKVAVAPSPLQSFHGTKVAIYLTGCADRFRCQVYSSASRQVATWDSPASGVQGWQNVDMPADLDLCNGQYFIKVQAEHGDKKSNGKAVFYVLR